MIPAYSLHSRSLHASSRYYPGALDLSACWGQGRTQIKYCTDGVLLREMMDDPLLSAYRCDSRAAGVCTEHKLWQNCCRHPKVVLTVVVAKYPEGFLHEPALRMPARDLRRVSHVLCCQLGITALELVEV